MEYKHHLPTLAELHQHRKPLKQVHKEVKRTFSGADRFAVAVTQRVGTIGFFSLLALWTIGWLLWNILAPVQYHFDPAPAFVVWLFTSNIIQLILLPLIMIGQNIESKFSEQRAQEDYEINLKAEQEIEVIIAHLENQNEVLLEIARKIDRK
jgi:uncharacterized membrane protein